MNRGGREGGRIAATGYSVVARGFAPVVVDPILRTLSVDPI